MDGGRTVADALNEEQRAWQLKARKFAEEEIRPISLACDHVAEPAGTWDWDIMRKGSRLGFRTAVVPKEWGGHGIDFVTQRVTTLNLRVHGVASGVVNAHAEKLVRDGIIWTHLAGDASQRLKVIRRLSKA